MTVWVCTSGWQYASWKRRFHPDKLHPAREARVLHEAVPHRRCQQLLLRLPQESGFVRWREESAPGFVVTVKASRYITHIKRLTEVRGLDVAHVAGDEATSA